MESIGQTPTPGQAFLGICVPGGPVRIDFVQTSQTKLTLTLNAPGDLPIPISSVSDLVCFLLPGAPIPPTHGLLVYWQVVTPAFSTGFELLGALTPSQPSGVFRTNWSQHEEICNQVGTSGARIVLGVSMETLEEIANVASHESYDARLFMAQKIATDLFHYMQSFDNGSAGHGKLVVPTNIFDRWMKRFESRFQRDPNFFMKNQD
eukprot:CAMPEP_0194212434 /NCGR_PEP_ID=MMETSP0156-20130528/12314_1 /TAXON_ID=33649 /ORGANISM="Thalassionema nitzschioides, Strain L26-B" /LENGTH=205 /DNA_ID=CAMNT_0038940259 /DNA_START=93 /DNA_END=710 /DNA_ORIENTATION=+